MHYYSAETMFQKVNISLVICIIKHIFQYFHWITQWHYLPLCAQWTVSIKKSNYLVWLCPCMCNYSQCFVISLLVLQRKDLKVTLFYCLINMSGAVCTQSSRGRWFTQEASIKPRRRNLYTRKSSRILYAWDFFPLVDSLCNLLCLLALR